jgi:hypothetical protein
LQAGFLVGEQRPAKEAEAIRARENGEEKTAVEFFAEGARMMALDLGARGFD